MKKKNVYHRYELLEDIVIPKGTVFEANLRYADVYGEEIQHGFALTKDSSGEVFYNLDRDDEQIYSKFRLITEEVK